MPISYFEQLKQNLTADATAKKAAYDAVYDAYTQAQFDSSGNLAYKTPGKLGTRDIQYDTQKRTTATGGESSGMLRSGQQAREMAENLAAYKADVLGASGQLAADKAAVDTGLSTSIAEAQAKYGTVPAASTPSTSTSPQTQKKEETVAPAPVFVPTQAAAPVNNKPVPQGPSLLGPGVFQPSAADKRILEEKVIPKIVPSPPAPKPPVVTPKPPVIAPKPPVVPAPKKVITPKRIGGL